MFFNNFLCLVSVLVEFLSEKYSDGSSVREISEGLNALIRMKNFSSLSIKPILNSIDSNIEMSQHPQSVRFLIFQIFQNLLNKSLNYLKTINNLFISIFIKIATNEKDPRNLIISFNINFLIIKNFNIKNYIEDLFDISFCYFPISFNPPNKNNYTITGKDLKNSLRKCISGNKLFAKDSIPSLLEKFTSVSLSVRVDVLETLKSCIENYGAETLEEYWKTFWDDLKYEVIHQGSEDEVTDLVLELFKTIVKVFSDARRQEDDKIHPTEPTESIEKEELEKDFTNKLREPGLISFLRTITNECNENIKTPEQKLAKNSASLLSKCSEGSPEACEYIINSTIPLIIESYSGDVISIPKQRSIIEVVNYFLKSSGIVYGTFNKSGITKTPNSLLKYKDSLFLFLTQALNGSSNVEVTLRVLAIDALITISELSNFLDRDELGLLIQFIDIIILQDKNKITVAKANEALIKFANVDSSLILDITFPALFTNLPDDENENEDQSVIDIQKKPKEFILNVLEDITINTQLLEKLIIRLVAKLDIVISNHGSAHYVQLIISTIEHCIKEVHHDNKTPTDKYIKSFLPTILQKVISSNSPILDDDTTVNAVSRLVFNITLKATLIVQKQLINDLFDIFLNNKPTQFLKWNENDHDSFKPLSSKDKPSKSIHIFTKALTAVSINVNLPKGMDLNKLILNIVEVLNNDNLSLFERLGYLELISILTNKWLPIKDDFIIKTFKSLILSNIENKSISKIEKQRYIEVLAWFIKSLILKNDPFGYDLINIITELLKSEELGKTATKAIEIIITPIPLYEVFENDNKIDDEIKKTAFKSKSNNKDGNIKVRQLYKQRLFNHLHPIIVDSLSSSSSTIKSSETSSPIKANLLTVLNILLRYTPSTIVQPVISGLYTLLLQTLHLPLTSDIKTAAIDTIRTNLQDENALKLAGDHIQSLIPILLKLSSKQITKSSTPQLRIASLKCLTQLAQLLDVTTVLPFKDQVIKQLGTVLDDKKRNVRKAAVDSRHVYYELGGSSTL